jgi:hypothetical protein
MIPKYRTVVCTNKNIYLLLKIILSNQVEVTPGPSANTSSDSIKYPCYICNIPVLWSDKGVACDKCDHFFYICDVMILVLQVYTAVIIYMFAVT